MKNLSKGFCFSRKLDNSSFSNFHLIDFIFNFILKLPATLFSLNVIFPFPLSQKILLSLSLTQGFPFPRLSINENYAIPFFSIFAII